MNIPETSFNLWSRKASTQAGSDNEELLGEDDLLGPDDKIPKTAQIGDCTTRKKACKNCICGRKDMENVKTIDPTANANEIPSGCGSCSLGDAFRCAQCPFLGKPAWKKDSKTGKVTIVN
ncbi:Anamorsin [Perkinsela sp. CCAP 1560/4]|nr:Anamorsin [Perkinsela sp. CCAP 1560/4]|eukprot:KNH09235.1 Anamorsin [Perkinsela sp. CCAP 1560/4]